MVQPTLATHELFAYYSVQLALKKKDLASAYIY